MKRDRIKKQVGKILGNTYVPDDKVVRLVSFAKEEYNRGIDKALHKVKLAVRGHRGSIVDISNEGYIMTATKALTEEEVLEIIYDVKQNLCQEKTTTQGQSLKEKE